MSLRSAKKWCEILLPALSQKELESANIIAMAQMKHFLIGDRISRRDIVKLVKGRPLIMNYENEIIGFKNLQNAIEILKKQQLENTG